MTDDWHILKMLSFSLAKWVHYAFEFDGAAEEQCLRKPGDHDSPSST